MNILLGLLTGAVCFMAFLYLISLFNLERFITRYYIDGECRHKFGKWSEVDAHDRQVRVCEKCGWIEKAYR